MISALSCHRRGGSKKRVMHGCDISFSGQNGKISFLLSSIYSTIISYWGKVLPKHGKMGNDVVMRYNHLAPNIVVKVEILDHIVLKSEDVISYVNDLSYQNLRNSITDPIIGVVFLNLTRDDSN